MTEENKKPTPIHHIIQEDWRIFLEKKILTREEFEAWYKLGYVTKWEFLFLFPGAELPK